jgi:hypothetical protein
VSDELRECPFCGKTFSSSYQLGSGQFGYGCNEAACGCEMNGYKSREEAVTAWNTRALEDDLRAERDAYMSDAARLADLWASVPWDEIDRCIIWTMSHPTGHGVEDADIVDQWLRAHAPQPEQEAQP